MSGPTTYYVRAELEEGGVSTLVMRTAREALASVSSFKTQGLKVKVTQDGGALISEFGVASACRPRGRQDDVVERRKTSSTRTNLRPTAPYFVQGFRALTNRAPSQSSTSQSFTNCRASAIAC